MITKISNINYFNTSQRAFTLGSVYFNDEIITYVGNDELLYDKEVKGNGRYLIPGLIDIHMHIESSMTNPIEFSNTVLPLGTTTIVADAHEIANVFGYKGLINFINFEQKLDIFHSIPSSVPASNQELETTVGIITKDEVKLLCQHPKIIALGEVMNFNDVVSAEDTNIKQIIEMFKKCKPGAPIEGHIPNINGKSLADFIMHGIGSDHTLQTPKSIVERTMMGIQVQLQEKSITKENIETLNRYNLHGSYCIVTDDVMPDDLISKGHLDHCVRKTIELGLRAEDAIYASTYTPAKRMKLDDRGIIAPGKLADFIILSELDNFVIDCVYKKGELITNIIEELKFNDDINAKSINISFHTKEDFILKSDKDKETLRVMGRNTTNTYTEESLIEVDVINGYIDWKSAGLNLVLVYDRSGRNTKPGIGFINKGFNSSGAICTSWAHDSHNLLVMGNDENKMYLCLEEVINKQGGMAIFSDKMSFLPLRYGGIVSIESMKDLASKVSIVRNEMKRLGYISHNEIMSFAVVSLLVSPELKINDKGYCRVSTKELVDWKV